MLLIEIKKFNLKFMSNLELQGYETQRLYAYLAERYLSFWFNKHTKTLAWPWIFFDTNQK